MFHDSITVEKLRKSGPGIIYHVDLHWLITKRGEKIVEQEQRFGGVGGGARGAM